MNNRYGHGHVTPNPDGSKARCGGPGICRVCQREEQELRSATPVYCYAYVFGVGYVVFRSMAGRVIDADTVQQNKVSVFVDEIPAADYCIYRNELQKLHGGDSLYSLRPEVKLREVKVTI